MVYQVKITPFANEIAQKLNPEIKKALKAALKELSKNPRFLHASTSHGVMISSLKERYWKKHYWTARRIFI